MTIPEYQKLTMRTFKLLNSPFEEVSHMVLGLMSEHNELSEAMKINDDINIKEEIGDKLWYLSNLANIFNVELDINFMPKGQNKVLMLLYSDLSNNVKRKYVYNSGKEDENIIYIINCIFRALIDLIVYLFGQDISILEEIMNKNINKLYIRYPDQYKDDYALIRNIQEELEQLKK